MEYPIDDLVPGLLDGSFTEDEFCEHLNASLLLDFLKLRYRPLSTRAGLCDYLGISESTLSGWIKDDRIPLSAKRAIALFVICKDQKETLKQVEKNKDQYIIIKENNAYKIARPDTETDGTPIWEVIAGDIPSLKDARLLSLPEKLQKMLDQISEEQIDDLLSRIENGEYTRYLKDLQYKINQFKKYVEDPKKYFGPLDLLENK